MSWRSADPKSLHLRYEGADGAASRGPYRGIFYGAHDRDRTGGPLLTKEVLYH